MTRRSAVRGRRYSLRVRVEGLPVYEHVLDYGVAVVVNADHHPHVLRALYDAAGPFGHEIRADAKVETAPVVDAALDEYVSVDIAAVQSMFRSFPNSLLLLQSFT